MRRAQQGVVLLIGLIMLIMLTLMALAAFKFGKSNFLVVANQQMRIEASRAAEQAIEQIVANEDIAFTDSAGLANLYGTVLPGASGPNEVPVDVNGDGTADYKVKVDAPYCVNRRVIAQTTLDLTNPNDLGCMRSVDQTALGIEGAGSADSLCSEVVFEVKATATDRFSGDVSVSLVQGLGQRVATTRAASVCQPM